VSVLLYMYHALSKQEITTAYSAANYAGDQPAVNALFGLKDTSFTHEIHAKDLHNFVHTVDVLIFHSNRDSELGHVALVLDNFEKLWVASHWRLPREKMIKITPNRIFTSSKDSALARFNTDTQRESDTLSQKQREISTLRETDPAPVEPSIIAKLKKDYMINKSYDQTWAAMASAKGKFESEYAAFSEFKIQDYEKTLIAGLYAQAQQLIHSFEVAIEKYRDNENILGIIYDFIDSFEQMSEFYTPLYTLEYLANDTVTVSTKFRPFFLE